MLEDFKVYYITSGVPSMTCTKNGVGISKAAAVRLGNPAYVRVLFDYSGKKMAIQACEPDADGATQFAKGEQAEGIRWNNRDMIATLERVTGLDIKGTSGYRFEGEIFEETRVLIFDLQAAETM